MKASPRFLLFVLLAVTSPIAAVAACSPATTVPSVNICSPGATSGLQIHLTAAARASTNVSYMAVWLDGIKKYEVKANSIDTYLSATSGRHRLTVQAKDASGNLFAKTIYTTVGSTSSWAISGSISPAITGLTVRLSGAKSGSITTNSSGGYSFGGLTNGSYTITPTSTNYTFTPTSKTVTMNGSNITGVGFTASPVSSGHYVDLSWRASTSASVSGYKVFRSTTSGGPYALLNSNPVTSTIYSDLNVAAGATYYYVVAAVDSAGNQSSNSNQTTVSIPRP